MAERAAHITSALSTNRPSIFEVLAQESLMSTVRPALKHAVKVLAEGRPDRFGWLLQWYEEFYVLLDLILQNYYLHNYSSSFAENFYGMKRVSIEHPTVKQLTQKVHWKSLLYLVIVPYIKHKMDDKFEDIRHRVNTGSFTQNYFVYFCRVDVVTDVRQLFHELATIPTNVNKRDLKFKTLKAFVGIYPYVHTLWEGTVLGHQLAYMFGKYNWHSPWIRLSGVELHNLDMEDMEESVMVEKDWSNASAADKMKFVAAKVLNMAATSLSTGLSVGVFFLQFLDWWYSSESSSPSQLMSLPVPQAPQAKKEFQVPPHNTCPVCMRTRTNDTALSVSGYVFCYPCIHEFVSKYHCCPVTNYPANQGHLVRLYQPDT